MDEPRMDQTVPGGRYKGADGRFHDAHGKLLLEDVIAPAPAGAAAEQTEQVAGEYVKTAVDSGESDPPDAPVDPKLLAKQQAAEKARLAREAKAAQKAAEKAGK